MYASEWKISRLPVGLQGALVRVRSMNANLG